MMKNISSILCSLMILLFLALSVAAAGDLTITIPAAKTFSLSGNVSQALSGNTITFHNSNLNDNLAVALPANIFLTGTRTNITASLSYNPLSFTVGNNSNADLNFTLNVPGTAFNEPYTGTLNFTSGANYDIATINLNVNANPSLTVNNPTVTIAEGFSNLFYLILTNNGNTDVTAALSLTSLALTSNNSITMPSSVISIADSADINYSGSTAVPVTVTVPDGQQAGAYTGNITASFNGRYVVSTLTVTVRDAVASLTPPGSVRLGSIDSNRGINTSSSFIVTNNGDFNLTDIVVSSNSGSSYQIQFSNDNNNFNSTATIPALNLGNSATIYLKGFIPSSVNSGRVDIGDIFLKSASLTNNVTIADFVVDTASKLNIEDVDVDYTDVNGNRQSKDISSEGSKIKDISPGTEIKFDIKIENTFISSDDIQIEDIETKVTIDNIDDGDEIDVEGKEFDIDADKSKRIDVTLNIPEDADTGDFSGTIDVKGTDEKGAKHTAKLTFSIEVERKDHNNLIKLAELRQPSIKCGTGTFLDILVVNQGKDDETRVALEAQSNELEVNFKKKDIELTNDYGEDDNKFKTAIPINVKKTVKPGTYTIRSKVFFSDTILDDIKDIPITVSSCAEEEADEDKKDEPEVIEVTTPPAGTASGEQTEGKDAAALPNPVLLTEQKESFRESGAYIALLALLILVVVGAGVALALLYSPRQPPMERNNFM